MRQDLRRARAGARIAPPVQIEAEAEGLLESLVPWVGYRPRALATMGLRPGLVRAVLELVNVVLSQDGRLAQGLRHLIACESARQAGCFYTATHLAHAAHRLGVPWEHIRMLASPDGAAFFQGAEWALLRLAGPYGSNDDRDAAWVAARAHWDSDVLAEAAGAIALAAWFSRWNMLIETELEDEPASAMDHVPWLRPSAL